MSAIAPALVTALRAVRIRLAADDALLAAPLVALAGALGWRLGGVAQATALAALGVLAAAALLWRRLRRENPARLARRLDSKQREFEDSTGLLLADEAALGPLQRLQRERLRQRLAAGPIPDLRPPWSRRRNLGVWLLALPLVAALSLWPTNERERGAKQDPARSAAVAAGAPRLVSHTLRIAPPAYTALPARELDGLEAKAPAGSRLYWTLRFAPQPKRAHLVFHDGTRVPLTRDGEDWTASHVLARAALYRVVPEGAPTRPPPPLHRLDAIADRAPRVRVLAPERTLSSLQPGQRSWALAFEASDDYGVAVDGRLHLTLARGSGENITFETRTRVLRGRGDPMRRRFEVELDLGPFDLAPGEDLVAQLEVRDTRAPGPQAARSPSLILRRPAEPMPDVVGLEGLARKVLPAYFRSQRQIIIDAEALLAERPRLDEARFLARSDGLGVDQRLLRLRYGQFLGEESEGGPRPLPTADAEDHAPSAVSPALPIDDLGQDSGTAPTPSGERGDGHVGEHDHRDPRDHDPGRDRDDGHAGAEAEASGGPPASVRPPPAHDHEHDHDHGDAQVDDTTFGRVADVLAEFGHTHDLPEAATLLDPVTRETLRGALREMWQSELHLRQGAPAQALPYAHRALELIKQVQQADRIYLARVGPELPPIDPARRLGGDRAGIASRALPAAVAERGADVPGRLWRALGDESAAGDLGAELDALENWLHGADARMEDPLALVAAVDALRNAPHCEACRHELRALLWSALAPPAAAVPRRPDGDDQERRYLDAIGQEPPR